MGYNEQKLCLIHLIDINDSEFVQLIENNEVLAESELMPCTWNNGMM